MIQRKQTLFLLAAAACALLTFLFPVARYTAVGGEQTFIYNTTGVVTEQGAPLADATLKFPLAIVFVLIAAVLAVVIVLFRNRPRQIAIVRATYLLIILSAYLMFSQHLSLANYLHGATRFESSFGITMYLPLPMLLFAFLAERSIRKDEELVKSMDRLR